MRKFRLFRFAYFFVAFFFFCTRNVQAYIDPSVMSYAIQAVAGVAIALGTVVSLYWRKFLKFFRTVFRVKSNHHSENESDEIVFNDPEKKDKKITPNDIKVREVKEAEGKYLIVHGKDNVNVNEDKDTKDSFSKKLLCIVRDLIPGILIVCAITYMLCYYGPLEMYMNNKDEFWFDYSVLQPQLLALCGTFLKIGILIYVACYVIHKKLYNGALFAGVSGLVILYIQGNYFANKLPGMDGSEIDWTKYMPQMEQSAILCLAVIIVVGLLYRVLKEKKFRYAVDFACVLITGMLVISLTDINNKQNGTEKKTNDYVVTKNNEYNYSSDSNFIIFVVDAFDSETFNNIVSDNSVYQEMFDGFTYYPDTVGAYTFTSRSIPFIMSGTWYENQEDYRTFEAKVVADSPILKSLQEQGYRLDAYEDEFLFDTDLGRYSNLDEIKSVLSNKYKLREEELNMVMFKYAPYFLKGNFTVNLDEFAELQKLKDSKAELYHMSDTDFYADLQNAEVTTVDDKVFKFIHIEGAHVPFNLDENMNSIDGGTYEQKQEATLTILNQYIQKLKDSDIYDNSTILIMGDHGYVPYPTDDENAVIARDNPLLMVKAAGEHHDLQWNDSPISYDDLQGAYQNLLNGADGNSAFDGLTEDNNSRRFLLYKWSSENVITEYYQNGYATDMDTMVPSGKVYKYKGKNLQDNLEGQ